MATALARVMATGPIAQSGLDVESAREQQRNHESDAAAVRLPIALIDALLGELEILNLAEGPGVPGSFQPSLGWLLDNCPVECPELSIRTSPVQLIDMLFDLQESLFALKGGDARQRLQLEDEHRAYRHGS